MRLEFFWDRDPDLLVFAGEWPTPDPGEDPRKSPFTVVFSHSRNLHDVATVVEMFPPPDGESWSLAAVPRAKLPKGSFRVTVHDDWEADANSPGKDPWFRELALADEPVPVGASATPWSEKDGRLTITTTRAATTTVANNGLDEAGTGTFPIPGTTVAVAPDPKEKLIEHRTFSVGPAVYRARMKGNTLYPTAYPESAEARTRVMVRIDKAQDHLGLALSTPDHAAGPITIEVLRLPRERLMDRNGRKGLLEECVLVETLQVSAAGSASWTLNAQAFAPLDRVVLRLGQTPGKTSTTVEPAKPGGWRLFGRKPPDMWPIAVVASPPVLVEFFVDGVPNAGFGPCLALANYLLDLEPDLALSRVLRNEQPEPGTAKRAHAARRLSLPSQLAYLQHARHYGGNLVPGDYLAHADRATLPAVFPEIAPDLKDRGSVMADLMARYVDASLKYFEKQDTAARISQQNLDELVFSDRLQLDRTRALVMNGPAFRLILALDISPAKGNEGRFLTDVGSLLDQWTDVVRERDSLAQIICPDKRPAPEAAPDEWQIWLRTVTDEYLGDALLRWMIDNSATVPYLAELTPLLSALFRTSPRYVSGPGLLWLLKVGRRVPEGQNDVQDPWLLVAQGATHIWSGLIDAIKAAHQEIAKPGNDDPGDRAESAFEKFKAHLLNHLGMGPETGPYGAKAWPGLESALLHLLESGAIGLSEDYDVAVQALVVRLRHVETEADWA